MKRLAVLFFVLLCLTGCGKITVENPDILKTAVLSTQWSDSANETLSSLEKSTVATLTSQKITGKGSLSEYDVIYIDKSVTQMEWFDPQAIEEYVSGGGCVFLDNEVYALFEPEFIGAAEFAVLDFVPAEIAYPSAQDKTMQKIQKLISDFCTAYKNYDNSLSQSRPVIGVFPSTAQVIASKDGAGIFTLNSYGDGYVFFTSPMLTDGRLSELNDGFCGLLRDYFAEFVSLKNYGYAIERVYGSFASQMMSWSVPVTQSQGRYAEDFENLCRVYSQIPSYSPYVKVLCGGRNVSVPFYLSSPCLKEVGFTNGIYSELASQYGVSQVFYNNLDGSSEDGIRYVATLAEDYGYSFAEAGQLLKMKAAAENTFVNAKWENDGLSLSAVCRDKEGSLYDRKYQRSVGVKIIFADGVFADEFGVDASVYYKRDNCIYVSLDGGARVSKQGEYKKLNITGVNMPAWIVNTGNSAVIRFLDGGLMSVTVKGNVRTTSKGWETTIQDGTTVFKKYGDAQTLKIER